MIKYILKLDHSINFQLLKKVNMRLKVLKSDEKTLMTILNAM